MNRTRWIWVLGVAVILLFNGLIITQEANRARLDSVYLELQPADPRSMMQGDYMRLGYSVTDQIEGALGSDSTHGRAVLRIDDQKIAHFERIYDGGELAGNEQLLEWTRPDDVQLEVETFMFQEGHADAYQDAEYAEVKLTEDGAMILVDLVDADLEPITPTETHKRK